MTVKMYYIIDLRGANKKLLCFVYFYNIQIVIFILQKKILQMGTREKIFKPLVDLAATCFHLGSALRMVFRLLLAFWKVE